MEFEILYGFLKVLAVEFQKNCTACWRHLHFYGLSIFPRDLDRNIDPTLEQGDRWRGVKLEKFHVRLRSVENIKILATVNVSIFSL